MKLHAASVVVGFLSLALSLVPLTSAQTAAEAPSALPHLVRFASSVKDLSGNPLTGVVGITFALYSQPTGGAALWLETPNITADSNGRYVALLGSTKPEGLPTDLFTSEQARWVGVQVSGQAERPRVLLVSAPYALKSGDAETLGGLPPSAFVLANGSQAAASAAKGATGPPAPGVQKNTHPPASPNVTGVGVVDYIPMWNTTSDIIDSILFQKSSQIGVNTTTPAALLDVNGKGDIRDTLTLFPKSTDSTLAISGTAFKVDQTGKMTFIAGQTFPGAGTITGITTASGSGLSGGGTTGTLSLKVPSAGITNAMLASSKTTLNANTAGGITTPGAMSLGSTYTIGLKTCSVNQILQFIGTAWACATLGTGTGTVTSVGLTAPSTDFTVSGSPVTTSGTLKFAWSVAPTSSDTANAIVKRDGSGNFLASTITAADVTLTDILSVSSSAAFPLNASSSFDGATVTSGTATSTTGEAWGVEGYTASNAASAYGVIGEAASASGNPIGVLGFAPNSLSAIGVFGQDGAESASALGLGIGGGVWGDGGGGTTSAGFGVIGTVDDGFGGYFENNSPSGFFTVDVVALNSASFPFIASGPNGYCEVDFDGNLDCSGAKNAVVPIDGGKRIVAMSAIESPQNWFEDFGSAQLLNGVAVVALDRDFIQTVSTEIDYKVFPVPNGDCKGLFVTHKTPASFEVRELGGGTSDVTFDYRVTALRKNYENVRFADHTHDLDGHKRMLARAHAAGTTHPQSHMPTKKLAPARPPTKTMALK
jgi:hypothetical protein